MAMTQANNEKELLKELYEHSKNLAFYADDSDTDWDKLEYKELYRDSKEETSKELLKIFEKHNYKPEETNE
jgi:hypothetical protein